MLATNAQASMLGWPIFCSMGGGQQCCLQVPPVLLASGEGFPAPHASTSSAAATPSTSARSAGAAGAAGTAAGGRRDQSPNGSTPATSGQRKRSGDSVVQGAQSRPVKQSRKSSMLKAGVILWAPLVSHMIIAAS